jgi:protein transport protein SEC23
MIQPALLKYTVQEADPTPVELDLSELQDEVILILDSFFTVLVWYGESVQDWREQKLD